MPKTHSARCEKCWDGHKLQELSRTGTQGQRSQRDPLYHYHVLPRTWQTLALFRPTRPHIGTPGQANLPPLSQELERANYQDMFVSLAEHRDSQEGVR